MGRNIELTEDSTMNPAKRPAEVTESAPIGSEKRIKASEDQGDPDYGSDNEVACYIIDREDRVRGVKKTREPAFCHYCNTITADHIPFYCDKYPNLYPSPPPPTSEDLANNCTYYCLLCEKYVDHSEDECPLEYVYGRYYVDENGRTVETACWMCGKEVHSGDCPDSPVRHYNDGPSSDEDAGWWA